MRHPSGNCIQNCIIKKRSRENKELEDLWTKTKPETNENENSQGTSRAEISSKHILPNLDSNIVSSKQLKGETKQKVQKNENYDCKTKPFSQNFPNKKKRLNIEKHEYDYDEDVADKNVINKSIMDDIPALELNLFYKMMKEPLKKDKEK